MGKVQFYRRVETGAERGEDAEAGRLVTRFQAGDRAAFAALYERYFDRVFTYLGVLLRSQSEAMDAAQEVFVSAFESLPEYEIRAAPFRAWLFTIAKHHAIKQVRRLGRVLPEEPEAVNSRREALRDTSSEPLSLSWVTNADLVTLIGRLPLSQQQVLGLRFILDLDDAQIASILGRTRSDVRTLQARGLAFLRQRLTALSQPLAREDSARMRRVPRRAPVTRARRFAITLPR